MRTWPPSRKFDDGMIQPRGRVGLVSLVGAGPGDHELITCKGLRRLRAADVVVYDRLVARQLIDEAPPHAERVDVGKRPGKRGSCQEFINELLIERAARGLRVVRLKGGDPFVFGRGGEEAAALARAGVPFEIVPGVSAAVGVPAYAGIPVTYRGRAASFTVVAGQEDATDAHASVDWQGLARLGGTIVVLMGVASMGDYIRKLVAGGLSEATPAAVIENGATPSQRVVTGTLCDIAERSAAAHVAAPAVVVIGDVAALRGALQWYDALPKSQDRAASLPGDPVGASYVAVSSPARS